MATRRASSSRRRPAAARHARRKGLSDPTPIFLGLGIVAIVAALLIFSKGSEPGIDTGPEVAAPREDTSWRAERVQAAARWLDAVATGDRMELSISTDLDALQRSFGIAGAAYATLSGDERASLKDAILDRLTGGEDTAVLRDFRPFDGRLPDVKHASSPAGRVVLDLQPRPQAAESWASDATVAVSFGHIEGRLSFGPVEVVSAPRPKVKPKPRSVSSHDTIAKPEKKVVERDGKQIAVWEAEIVPLEHLADTAPELRTEIDQTIEKLLDIKARPRVRTEARDRLSEIGKPAVPRLLTRFAEIPTTSPDDIARLTQLVHLLRDMTGRSFGYSPAEHTTLASPEESEAARQSALKQWYAWWYYYHDKPLDLAIQDEEDLFADDRKKKN